MLVGLGRGIFLASSRVISFLALIIATELSGGNIRLSVVTGVLQNLHGGSSPLIAATQISTSLGKGRVLSLQFKHSIVKWPI